MGLAVILCLHGAPGGQSGHHACGFEDDDWTPEMWDVPESVRCIEHIAVTRGHPNPSPNPSPSPNPNP